MRDDFPRPVPGSALKALRQSVGVMQKDIADRVGVHRTELHKWENEPEVDAIRATRYQDAVSDLYAEKTARKAVA